MTSITQRTFQLAAPHWLHSKGRKGNWLLGGTLVSLVVLVTLASYWMNLQQKAFFDALQNRDGAAFQAAISMFFMAIGLFLAASTIKAYAEQALAMRWRMDMTEGTLGRWLQGHTFYRMERDALCDNPDQRIADDIAEYVKQMINLSLGFLANLGTLGTMGWILWESAGPMTFEWNGNVFTIPGYLFWLAIGWGVLQTLVTHLAGHKLAAATVEQQTVEADFRFSLAKVRDAAEQIALYGGQPIEHRRSLDLFKAIQRNWSVLMKHNVYLNVASGGFSGVAVAVPIVAVAPKVLTGELTLGTLMQDVGAFAATAACIAWFALSYRDLFQLSARVQRLSAMNEAMQLPDPKGIDVQRTPGISTLESNHIALALPNGRLLTEVNALSLAPGERWLVRGPSGCGKSTLLRAIAGLWPFGSGHIQVPKQARVIFMPQKGYLPSGPLSDALVYPSQPGSHSHQALIDVLTSCRLPHLVSRLGETARWGHTLSPGEQQRLAFAQVLLFRPDVLFMDEATSALDNDTEAHVIQLVMQRLPQCTLVSVAHRTTLDGFHNQRLDLRTPAMQLA
jgi:putative ATP-binding cassette transporter